MSYGMMKVRQSLFCRYYVNNGGNGADAARKAGYSKKAAREIAHRLLSYDHVKAQIDQLMAEKLESLEASDDWVVRNLMKIIRKVDVLPEDKFTADHVLKAIQEVNKMGGYYAPTESVNTNVEQEQVRKDIDGIVMSIDGGDEDIELEDDDNDSIGLEELDEHERAMLQKKINEEIIRVTSGINGDGDD